MKEKYIGLVLWLIRAREWQKILTYVLRVLSIGDLNDTINGNMKDVKEDWFFLYVYCSVVLDYFCGNGQPALEGIDYLVGLGVERKKC